MCSKHQTIHISRLAILSWTEWCKPFRHSTYGCWDILVNVRLDICNFMTSAIVSSTWEQLLRALSSTSAWPSLWCVTYSLAYFLLVSHTSHSWQPPCSWTDASCASPPVQEIHNRGYARKCVTTHQFRKTRVYGRRIQGRRRVGGLKCISSTGKGFIAITHDKRYCLQLDSCQKIASRRRVTSPKN